MLFRNILKALIYLSIALFSFTNLYSQTTSSERQKQIEKSIYVSDVEKDLSDKLQKQKQSYKQFINQLYTTCIQNKYRTALSDYFNTILKTIISNNQHILPENKKDPSKFCILIVENDDYVPGFSDYGNEVTILNINFDFLDVLSKVYTSDAAYVATIAHELAHNILNHNEKSIDTKLTLLNKNITNYQDNPTYIKIKRQNEEEADTLGLEFYLNAGFKENLFREHYLTQDQITLFNRGRDLREDVSDETWNFFEKLSNKDTCFSEGFKFYRASYIQQLGPKPFDNFMNKIKFMDPKKDSHPTGCWRYWNAYKRAEELIKENNKFLSNTVENFIYVQVDLSSYKNLNIVKEQLNTDSFLLNTSTNSSNTSDPRFSIIKEIFNNPSINFKFTLSEPSSNIGKIKDDNMLILKACNYMVLEMFYLFDIDEKELKDKEKDIHDAYFLYKELNKDEYIDCIDKLNALKEHRNLSIKKAFTK